jgi:hypothetical protein
MDEQQIEILGRNILVGQLIRAGFEVSSPLRDRGVDLIAYLDVETDGVFRAIPIQLKCASGTGFCIDRKYARFSGLVIVNAWHIEQSPVLFATRYNELLKIAEAMDYTSTESWQIGGRYAVTNPGVNLQNALSQFAVDEKKWKQRLLG